MRILCIILAVASFLIVGCGGSSEAGRALIQEGVYSSETNVPGIGSAMLIVTVDSRGRGKVMVQTSNSHYKDDYAPRKTGSAYRDEVNLLSDSAPHVVELEQVGSSVHARVTYGGQTTSATMARSAFAKAGDPPPVPAGSYWQTSAQGNSIQFQIESIVADGQGGWNIKGTVVTSAGETPFGQQGYASNLTDGCLSLLSPGGSIYGSNFPSPTAAATTISFFGTGGGAITADN
ncbi:MAG: hypothetical protein K1X67_00890 [Fimbriimonadaceae bacterium]|nr:hypothetical protein [Fimbriimonadaceae bacterium]